MENKKPIDAIEILTYHQQWRLGVQDDAKYTPRDITIAIDEILEYLYNIKTN
jgi:hypothetical protein